MSEPTAADRLPETWLTVHEHEPGPTWRHDGLLVVTVRPWRIVIDDTARVI